MGKQTALYRRRRARSVAAAFLTLVLAGSFLVVPGAAVQAAPATTTPDPFYGTWSDALSPTSAAARTEMDRQAASGVGLIRQYVWWDRIETSPGVFDWRRTDELIGDATARGITVLPTLLYTPEFYSSKPPDSTSRALFPPTDPETMARFAEAMVRRYGPNGSFWCLPRIPPLPPSCRSPYAPVEAWEVWNEPDFPFWWKGAPNAGEYVTLLRAVAGGIRRADPSAEVVLGALTNRAAAPGAFLDQLYDLGAAPYFDTIAINPYAKDIAGMVAYVRGARSVADANGDGATPIRVGEYGWATLGDASRVLWSTTEPCQAALLYAGTRRLAALRTELNIRSVIQFQWHDVATTSLAWPHYTGVFRPDDSAKPSHAALSDAIAGRPTPAGLTLAEACAEDRRALDPAGTPPVADDSFSRTTSDGWGSAETGGAYTVDSPSSFSVAGGEGRIDVPAAGAGREAVLGSTSARNVDLRASVSTDKAATGTTGQRFTLLSRRVAPGSEYRVHTRFSPDGAVLLGVAKANGGTETPLGEEVPVPGVSHVPGRTLVVRVRVRGASPTTIDAKVWAVGAPEPSAWQLTRTDSEGPLQSAGAVGARASLSESSVLDGVVRFSVDDLHATSPK
ncbi:MAG: hypothetical protein M3R01_01590 [Actinomycetota bacterium]|nr:hypothetical protein [Actinomycetota bacterium]